MPDGTSGTERAGHDIDLRQVLLPNLQPAPRPVRWTMGMNGHVEFAPGRSAADDKPTQPRWTGQSIEVFVSINSLDNKPASSEATLPRVAGPALPRPRRAHHQPDPADEWWERITTRTSPPACVGRGVFADIIRKRMQVATRKAGLDRASDTMLDTSQFVGPKTHSPQGELF